MTNQNEALSALADNALGADELQQLLERLHAEPNTLHREAVQREVAQRLERYALLGELMRADAESPLMARNARRDVVTDVMQRVRADALQPELDMPQQVVTTPEKVLFMGSRLGGWMSGWRAPALSMALAASIAGVMLLVVKPESPIGQQPGVLTAQVDEAAAARLVAQTSPKQVETEAQAAPESLAALESAADADVDAVPDAYLLQHLTHTAGGPMRTLSSNMRLASYERP
jgi:hypothetical protein